MARPRRAPWPYTPDPHVLISEKTTLRDGAVTRGYVAFHLQPRSVGVERICRDRVLNEALTGRPGPLHLALMFCISQATASKYTLIAGDLLDGQPAQAQQSGRGGPAGIPELSGVEGSRPGSCCVLPGGH